MKKLYLVMSQGMETDYTPVAAFSTEARADTFIEEKSAEDEWFEGYVIDIPFNPDKVDLKENFDD